MTLLPLLLLLATADDEMMSALNEHHRHHHHGGITQFVEMSLDTLGEEQGKHAQVEKVQEALHECMEPVEDQEETVLAALAEGVEKGEVNVAKVDAAIGKLTAAANAVHPCVAGPLNTLHGLLSPLERAELTEKVRAHWEVWRHVNVELPLDSRDSAGGLASVERELAVTPAQADKMAAALKAKPAGKLDTAIAQQHILSFVKAFKAETFDATSVSTHSTAELSTFSAMRMATFYETIVPMLTAEQRSTLVAHLREHATHHPGSP
jgi:hypothetical protein